MKLKIMRFLIQQIDDFIHDFSYELVNCKAYGRLYYELNGEKLELQYTDDLEFKNIENPDLWVPVGSVEFVSAYLRKFYPEAAVTALLPLNVPDELFPFAGRSIANCYNRDDFRTFAARIPDLWSKRPTIYRKNLQVIKDPFNGPIDYPYDATDFRGCQISPVIDILSEWRVFVFHGMILDCRNYAGDFFMYPNPETIRQMVKVYDAAAPVAYTLDVAVTPEGKTVVIECHRFFSCGLYGFSDIAKYPKMLSQAWFQMKTMKND